MLDERLKSMSESPRGNLAKRVDIDEITEAVSDAYSDNKISKIHYDLLNERISKVGKQDGNDGPTQ